MEDTNELIQQRIKKVEELRELGIEPYGDPFDASDHTFLLKEKYADTSKELLESEKISCSLAGRIVAMRGFGKAAFAHIQDATGKLQIYFKKDVLGERFKLLKKVDIGDIIGIRGTMYACSCVSSPAAICARIPLNPTPKPFPDPIPGMGGCGSWALATPVANNVRATTTNNNTEAVLFIRYSPLHRIAEKEDPSGHAQY